MAFGGVVKAFAEGIADEYGASYVRAMLPSIVRAGVREGYSGAEIMRQLQAADAGLRSVDFYKMLGEVKAGIEAGEEVGAIDLFNVPDAEAFTDWEVTKGSGYIYKMQFYYVKRDETGRIYENGTRDFAVRSSMPITPGEALQEMYQTLQESDPNETDVSEVFHGGEITGLYRMVT